MIPFYKILSLFMRVLSRPIIAYTEKFHSSRESQSRLVRWLFIRLGNFHHRMTERINRKFLKIEINFAYKPLEDQIAIKRGVQFFYQILLYSIMVGMPVYEMWLTSQDSAAKSRQIDRKLKNVEEESDIVLKELQAIANKLKEAGLQAERELTL